MQKELTKYAIWSSTRCFSTSSVYAPGISLSLRSTSAMPKAITFPKAQEKSRGTAESHGRRVAGSRRLTNFEFDSFETRFRPAQRCAQHYNTAIKKRKIAIFCTRVLS